MAYDLKLEKELRSLGFKKKFLYDKSGYWMEKKLTKFKDLDLLIYVETDRKVLSLHIRTGVTHAGKLHMNQYYDDVKNYKLTLPNIKKLIKTYGK